MCFSCIFRLLHQWTEVMTRFASPGVVVFKEVCHFDVASRDNNTRHGISQCYPHHRTYKTLR